MRRLLDVPDPWPTARAVEDGDPRPYRWARTVLARWVNKQRAEAKSELWLDFLEGVVHGRVQLGSAESLGVVRSAIRYYGLVPLEEMTADEARKEWKKARAHLVKKRKRETGGDATKMMLPIVLEDLREMLAQVDRRTLRGARDAALLLLGFHTATRRAEVAALDVEDVVRQDAGLSIRIRDSKGGPAVVHVVQRSDADMDPVRALEDWVSAAGISEGRIFRGFRRDTMLSAMHPAAVAAVVRAYAEQAKLVQKYRRLTGKEIELADFGGHSLRAGYITSALRQNIPEAVIRKQTRHASTSSFAKYYREQDPLAHGADAQMKDPE